MISILICPNYNAFAQWSFYQQSAFGNPFLFQGTGYTNSIPGYSSTAYSPFNARNQYGFYNGYGYGYNNSLFGGTYGLQNQYGFGSPFGAFPTQTSYPGQSGYGYFGTAWNTFPQQFQQPYPQYGPNPYSPYPSGPYGPAPYPTNQYPVADSSFLINCKNRCVVWSFAGIKVKHQE